MTTGPVPRTVGTYRPAQSGLPNGFSMKLLGAALTLTIVVVGALGWYAWDSYHGFKTLKDREFRLQELVGSVRHLDEVLTMSTRMAVATGDLQWEDRYRRYEPVLRDAIHEVIALAREIQAGKGIAETDAANDKLVEMEYRSFELLRKGRGEDAAALLSGTEYASQKDAYEEGMKESLSALQKRMEHTLESRRKRAYQAATAVVVVLPIILLSWLYAFRTLNVYLKARRQAEEALQTAHSELEERIEERTADLTATNKQLHEEIAERQQVEATLRDSEERFRALFEDAPDSILQIDPNTGGFVRFNTRTHENLGYTREEFEKLTIADLETVESEKEVARHIEKILETGSDTFETKHRAKDGTIRDVLVNCRIVSAHGQRLFQTIWTDITEHNRAEEALRDSSKRLAALAEEQQTLLRHTRDFLYRHDTQGVFDYLSPAVEQVTGRTVEEWRKHYSTYMTDNPINQKVFTYTEETLRTGEQSPSYLVEIMHKDGRRIMLEVNEGAYFDEGKVAGIIGVARDVTDRIQAQEALRASEQRLQGILDNTTAVIYVKDQDGSYLLANRRFEELFHVSREEIFGKTDYDFFSKDRADAFRANDKRVLKECRPVEFEEVVPQDDGVHTYMSLKFPLYDSQNKPYAVCGISADITERQRARQALQEAKEAAEAASKAKSTFLANVSHEIRTPIMAMLGTAELMSHGGTDRPTPERLDVILRSGHHLLSLVEDLLDLSRAEQGKLEIRYTVCSLFEIMADVEAVIAPLQREGEVDFRVFFETEIPARIHTDPTRLKQALINLISNALKFTDEGHVFVRVGVDREAADPRLAVSVEDTGRGIDSGDLQRIFDIFMQVDGGASTVQMGVGLGLPLAKWIASQLGGTLDVTSAAGRGSTFTLRVATGPVSDVEWVKYEDANASRPVGRADRLESRSPTAEDEARVPAGADLPRQKPAPRLRGRVLLAEDVRDLRELISDVLADVGAEVTTVSDGEEAVKTALEGSFDVILMDVYMPKVAGSDATAELRKRGCVTPIIALTASTAPGDRERLLEGGFDDLWAKPISMERIVDGVADYLDQVADESDSDDRAPPSLRINSARLASAVAEFSRSLPSRLQAVRKAIEADDTDRAHNLLHQLVGTAGTLGFMPVSREAARLLSKIKDGSFTNEPDALRPLEELIKTSKHRNVETSKRRNIETSKRQNVETSKRRNIETSKRQNVEKSKSPNVENSKG